MVALKDHPKYAKYFKMLKMGLPLLAAQNKAQQDGVDPSVLERGPNEQVPVDSASARPRSVIITFQTPAKKKALPRKKKLHWDALDKTKLNSNSLWAQLDEEDEEDDAVEIDIDADEFNSLFVQAVNSPVPPGKVEEGAQAGVASAEKPQKAARVSLIDSRRAQNAEIALKRVKRSFTDICADLDGLDASFYSADQLESLKEFLPSRDEERKLSDYQKKHPGQEESLGPAESFMLAMLGCRQVQAKFDCLLFHKHFSQRVGEWRETRAELERACDDVKLSAKLKRVMKTILKVGNQLNKAEGKESTVGFKVDSLLKLESAKAFDKKTSVLQYVIRLIQRSDPATLDFPSDLKNVGNAARLSVDNIRQGYEELQHALKTTSRNLELIQKQTSDDDSTQQSLARFAQYVQEAERDMATASEEVNTLTSKFKGVLEYFGEDDSLSSEALFSTLHRFGAVFKAAADALLRQIKSEVMKKAREDKENEKQQARERRNTALPPPLEQTDKYEYSRRSSM